MPASGTCPELPLATGDYAYVRSMMELLDDELRKAAESADVTYVDVLDASDGHDICAGDKAWVNGGTSLPGVATGYHPFVRGQRRGRRPRPGRPRRVSPGSAVGTRWLVAVLLLAMPALAGCREDHASRDGRAVRRAG